MFPSKDKYMNWYQNYTNIYVQKPDQIYIWDKLVIAYPQTKGSLVNLNIGPVSEFI